MSTTIKKCLFSVPQLTIGAFHALTILVRKCLETPGCFGLMIQTPNPKMLRRCVARTLPKLMVGQFMYGSVRVSAHPVWNARIYLTRVVRP